MSYTKEERMDIGKQIYNNEISKSDAAIKYRISEGTARDYMRLYRDANGLPPKNRIQTEEHTVKICRHSSQQDLSEYESMTKEEPIKELVRSRINEARLKKGYEVKGVGVDRIVTIFDSWNMKLSWSCLVNFRSSCYVKQWGFKEAVSITGKNALQTRRQKQKPLQTISFFSENTI